MFYAFITRGLLTSLVLCNIFSVVWVDVLANAERKTIVYAG